MQRHLVTLAIATLLALGATACRTPGSSAQKTSGGGGGVSDGPSNKRTSEGRQVENALNAFHM